MSTQEIIKRYSEVNADANLSCGGNLNYLALKPGEKVLDLGSGRGSEALEAAFLVGPGGFVWGLDLTPMMIEAAQEQASSVGVKNVEFVLSSIEQIPFRAESIDALISNCVINHVADKLVVYQEIYRVLRPGGRFVVSDIMTEEPLPKSIKEDPEAIAACFGGAISVKEYEDILGLAGFPEIDIFQERHYLKNEYEMISRTFRGRKPGTSSIEHRTSITG